MKNEEQEVQWRRLLNCVVVGEGKKKGDVQRQEGTHVMSRCWRVVCVFVFVCALCDAVAVEKDEERGH